MLTERSFEHDIFLAHESKDRDFAGRLRDALGRSCDVFLDSDMRAVENWQVGLGDAQRQSAMTVALLSSNADRRSYIWDEIANAIKLSRLSKHGIVPVYLDEDGPPSDTPYGLAHIVSIYQGRQLGVDAIAERLLAVLADTRGADPPQPWVGDRATTRSAATVKLVRDLKVGGSAVHDFLIEDFMPDLYLPYEVDRVALEKLATHGNLFIVGGPKSGKTRLAWELIRRRPDAVVVIPRAVEPAPEFELSGVAGRDVIMFVDDLHALHLETDLTAWRARLEPAAKRFQLICAARDGKGMAAIDVHRRPAEFLKMLPPEARLDMNEFVFGEGLGWALAEKLGVSRDEFRSHFNGTPWSVIYMKKAPGFTEGHKPLNNLPPLPRPLGRDDEIDYCIGGLTRDGLRLLTITGPSGVGKTVLGVAIAQEIFEKHSAEGFDDGVCFVDVSKVTSPLLFTNEIADKLGVIETSDSSLVASLETKRLLLLLDNFEHLPSAAALVRELIDRTRYLKILATSQVALGEWSSDLLDWESQRPLKPLDVSALSSPAPGTDLRSHPAVKVFTKRLEQLGRAAPDDAADLGIIAEVCAMVQGLPLALQIVASYSTSLGLKRALNMLRGQNLEALDTNGRLCRAFEMSYHNLGGRRGDDREQQLLQRLTAFAGSFTFERVRQLYEALGEPQAELDKCLSLLVRRSLLEVDSRSDIEEPRYYMLQSIKVYARRHLEEEGRAPAVRAAYAQLYSKLVREAEPHLNRPERDEWLNLLEVEQTNLRAVLRWCLETDGERHKGAELTGRLFWFWNLRSYFREGRQWAGEFIDKTEAFGDTEARAKALYCEGGLGFLEGSYEQAHQALARSVVMWRRLRNLSGLGYALIILGMVQANREELGDARQHEEESVEIFRGLKDRWGLALALNDLGNVVTADGVRILLDAGAINQEEANEPRRAQAQGLYDAGRAYYHESFSIWKDLGDDWGLPLTLTNLGTLSYAEKKYAAARGYFEQALEIHRRTGSKWGLATALRGLGRVAAAEGDTEQAVRAYYESFMLHREIGRAQLTAECLDGFADLAGRLGQVERAGCLLGAAKRLRDDWKLWKVPGHRKRFQLRVTRARGETDGLMFERAMAEGYGWGSQELLDSVTSYVGEWVPDWVA